ncbi:Dabb family protein [Mycolicibacterium sp.]|uniref:Dabb family protein n=1 Tax=Mycolicibacterium sp. TaxID=2320850 RepID=UPI003D11CE88
MAFTHIVTFKWTDPSYADQPLADALQSFVTTIDGVISYLCGPDAGVSPNTYDFAVVGTFSDRDAFLAYRDHPEHQRILNEMIVPHLETRTTVQLQH